jgi:hypothetical protein
MVSEYRHFGALMWVGGEEGTTALAPHYPCPPLYILGTSNCMDDGTMVGEVNSFGAPLHYPPPKHTYTHTHTHTHAHTHTHTHAHHPRPPNNILDTPDCFRNAQAMWLAHCNRPHLCQCSAKLP